MLKKYHLTLKKKKNANFFLINYDHQKNQNYNNQSFIIKNDQCKA